jgi:diguanylate cyclase (GGDEF)-like protein
MAAAPSVLLLVAPDDADHRLVRDLLEDADALHRVTTVGAALAAEEEHSHDVVLLAAEAEDGDALRRLLEEGAQTPVIVLDDESGPAQIDEATGRGAVDHLPRRGLTAAMLHRAVRYAVEHRRTVDRLRHDVLHDALTGLPNRTLFLDRLTWSLRRARRRGGRGSSAVLFLDLNRFKAINDSLGHQAGDQLLQAVARRLGGALRPGDTVARLSGDEFTVLLEDIGDPREATAVAERVQVELAEPIAVAGRDLVVTTAIGIALTGPDITAEDLIRDADVAMYRAKADGSAHAVFDGAMHRQVRARLQLESDLREAIAAERVELRYQPIVRTDTGEVACFEALSRWAVDPAEFVAVAEESGLIVPLGRFVLTEAARRAAEWDVTVAVNVSARQLRDPGFAGALEAALAASGAEPQRLRLEVTEDAMGQDPEAALRTLRDARSRLGIHAHLDDFGAGTSSLRFLHRFPGDALKIDRGLVLDMLHDPGALEIVKAVVGLADSLGMEVIAEGVETAAHLDELKPLGCQYAQGFHLAAPLTADEVRDLLEGARAGTPA